MIPSTAIEVVRWLGPIVPRKDGIPWHDQRYGGGERVRDASDDEPVAMTSEGFGNAPRAS
jgi:hypothetical protein